MDLNLFLSFLKTVFVLAGIIVLANISLRLLNRQMSKSNTLMEVVDKIGIGNNSTLVIAKICDEYYLFSSTSQENKLVEKLDEEKVELLLEKRELKEETPEEIFTFWKRGSKVE